MEPTRVPDAHPESSTNPGAARARFRELRRVMIALAMVTFALLAACSAANPGEETDSAQLPLCHTADVAGTNVNCPTNPPPPTSTAPNCNNVGATLTASPSIVALGQSTTLTWSIVVGTGCSKPPITVDGQSVPSSGSMVVTPPSGPSYGYTLVTNGRLLTSTAVTVVPNLCSGICTASSACDAPCSTAGLAASTCGGAGICQQCSASVCNEGTCDAPCLQGATLKTCNAWSYDTANDADLDGVPDALENALARRFAPTMHLLTSSFRGEPSGDWGELYDGSTYSGNWPFIVRPVTPSRDTTSIVTVGGKTIASGAFLQCAGEFQCLEITYVFPYNWDTGGPFNIGDHRGDGEMYSVLVARKDPTVSEANVAVTPGWNYDWSVAKNDPTMWVGYSEFGTAHTCDQYDSSNWRFRTFRPEVDGPTEIWVSESKHANYFSKSACDSGACSGDVPGDPCWDTCDDIGFTMVFGTQYGSGMGPLLNAGELACHSHPSINHYTLYPGDSPSDGPFGTFDVWADIPFGDDEVGRPIVLLRPNTMVWWQDDHANNSPDSDHAYGPYQCWPGPTSTPPPPADGGGSGVPTSPCGSQGKCCEENMDGSCSLCAPANGECP